MDDSNTIVLASRKEVDKENDPRWSKLTYQTDKHKRVWTYDANGKNICGAITRAGAPCPNSPVSGRNRCRMHGGKSLSGLDHPQAKHLRYSRNMIDRRMLNEYETAFDNPDILSLRDNIALADVRISEIVGTMESGESQKAWLKLSGVFDDFVDAHNSGKPIEALACINEMSRIIKFGLNHYNKWEEVRQTADHRRRLTETEHKMQADMKQVMTHDQAMGLLAHAVSAVRKRVLQYFPDERGQECLAAISQDIAGRVAGAPPPPSSEEF